MRERNKAHAHSSPDVRRLRQRIADLESSINEHKRALKKVRQQNKFFNTVIESLPHPFYIIDADDYTILKTNSAAGLLPTSEMITCYELIHKKSRPCNNREHPCPLDQVKKSKKLVTVQHRHYDREGNPKFCEITAQPIFDDKGNITQIIASALDITDRKLADDLMHIQHDLAVALSAEHELSEGLRLCFDAAIRVSGMDCGGIYLVDEISGAFNLVFHKGLTPDFVRSVSHYDADSDNARIVMAGKPVYNRHLNLGVPLDEAEIREGLLAMAIIPIHFQNRVIGCINIASHTVVELPFSARSALEIIASQIGSAVERLKSEEAFRKSKARFRGLVDLLQQTVFEIDEKGDFSFVNAFGFESFGYTQEDIDKGLNALQLFIPKDRERVQENIRRVLNGENSRGNEYTALRKDGGTFPVIVYSSPIIGEGTPEGLRGILIDITERKRLIEERLNNLERLRRSLEETISALVSTLEARDPYTAGHQKRVAELAIAIATEMGLPNDQIDGIRMAGLVHDIGKIYIPSDFLNKTNHLNGPEYELFKSHCQVGYDILKTIDFPWPVAAMVLQHHERMDGSGYPQGLYGRDIILEARILAVADVIEAMSGHRPYRPAYSVGDALEEILHHKDSLYDPEVVDACLRVFYNKGFTFPEVEKKKT